MHEIYILAEKYIKYVIKYRNMKIMKTSKKNNTVITVWVSILTLVTVFYVLYIGSSIAIPMVVALLFSFAVLTLAHFFESKWIRSFLAFFLSLACYGTIFWIIALIINSNIEEIIRQAPQYQEKLTMIIGNLATQFSIDRTIILQEINSKADIPQMISNVVSATTSLVRSTGTIFFFTIFILLESRHIGRKLKLMTDNTQIFDIIDHVKKDIKTYFVIKTLVSLATGITSYMILIFFGIDFALFWAFLIFLLNYIPTVGSIIAVIFPVTFSLLQFESWSVFVLLLIILTSVQLFFWNFLEPRLQGNKLNLSPLVIIFSLLFWWQMWWVVGMLLCVPIMVMINIVLSHIPATRSIAILLSEQGNIRFSLPKQQVAKGRFTLRRMHSEFFKKKPKNK